MVLFIVALCSIIVINLTYSSYLESRLSNASIKSLQAEYLLKSTINFARILVKEDTSPQVDGPADIWAKFSLGQAIPVSEYLGITEPGLNIEIEIQAEEAKIPLRGILTGDSASAKVNKKWRDAVMRYFQSLNFDQDGQKDHTNTFPNRVFNAEELVAVLVDYMDKDSDSYQDDDFTPGVEGSLEADFFPNRRIRRIGELQTIPGFTPLRMRQLTPTTTVFRNNRININLANANIIKSLHEDITDAEVELIEEFRNREEPFNNQNLRTELTNILGEEVYNDISSMITVKSRWFQVTAKVDYGTTSYFMRSYISRSNDPNELPRIRSVELF